MKRWLPIAAVVLAVVALHAAGALEPLERLRVDLGFRLAGRTAQSDLTLVEIDPRSLHALGVWPWPRGYHATVLERLFAAGARRVGFDVEFSSRSERDEDAELAQALDAAGGRVVLPVFREWQTARGGGLDLVVVEPLPELARHATLASINVRPESDGLVRRYENRSRLSDRTLPGFAAALAGDVQPGLDAFHIDYGISSRSIPRLAYVDVLTGRFDGAAVAGRTVIVGSTAVELGDQIAVPVATALPGPLVQALAYESLLQGRALRRAGAWTALAGVALIGLLLGPLYGRLSWRAGLALGLGACVAQLAAAAAIERAWPVLLDAAAWPLVSLGLWGGALVVRIDQQALGLRRQRRAIDHNETLMRHVVQSSFDAIVTCAPDGTIETFNRAASSMFGCPADAAIGRPLESLVRPAGDGSAAEFLARATGSPTEAAGLARDGRCFPVEIVVTAIDALDDPKLVAVIRDITDLKAHQEELKHRASHDALTGLPNRWLLLERSAAALHGARETGTHVALMLLDLDRFKEINDALGHAVGDELLRAVSRRLAGPLEPPATLARLGGDEFAVLLPATTPERARWVGRQLIEALERPFAVESLSLQVDTSVGITLFPEHGADAQTLIQRADVAMYVAKESRRGLAVYDPDQDRDYLRRLMIKGELQQAIDHDLLRLVYQPKVHHATDRIVGAEALLRWEHPEHGPIPPDEFAGVAEHSGLIRPLTQWVLETALDQAERWHRAGTPLGMAINVSARNLLEEDLPERLGEQLERRRLAPRHLTLEITESVIMADPERAVANMRRLRKMGVGIAVDDFGTGYSSLAYLARLPVTELKIDKSFVLDLDRDDDSATIVRSTIDLAHKLGIQVVAEGVETATAWETLKRLGCDVGQGYHFGRPAPADELSGWLAETYAPSSTGAMRSHCATASSLPSATSRST